MCDVFAWGHILCMCQGLGHVSSLWHLDIRAMFECCPLHSSERFQCSAPPQSPALNIRVCTETCLLTTVFLHHIAQSSGLWCCPCSLYLESLTPQNAIRNSSNVTSVIVSADGEDACDPNPGFRLSAMQRCHARLFLFRFPRAVCAVCTPFLEFSASWPPWDMD